MGKFKQALRQMQSIADSSVSAWMEKNNYWKTDKLDAVIRNGYKGMVQMRTELTANHKTINDLKTKLTASQRKTDEQASALRKANDKVDHLYNLFSYAEQDEDVLEMTGGKPLLGWLREREEEWYKTQGEL